MATLAAYRTFPRHIIMAYFDGILLDFKRGVGIVTEADGRKAEELLEAGEAVFLTIGNTIFSKLHKVESTGCYQETPVKRRKKI